MENWKKLEQNSSTEQLMKEILKKRFLPILKIISDSKFLPAILYDIND